MKHYSFVFAYVILMAIPALIALVISHQVLDIRALLFVTLATFLVGGVLEIWAVKQGKRDKFYIWEYNSKTTLNKKVMGIAIEDLILFLFLTPIFTITVWEASKIVFIKYNIPTSSLFLIGVPIILLTYFIVFKITKPKFKKGKRR